MFRQAESVCRIDESTKKFPGAYKEKSKLLGLMRDNIKWKLVEILESGIREA